MNKKKIKVYLQYPWKFPDSPYYKYLVNSQPKGIEFLNTKKQKGVITNKRFFWFSNFLKRNIRRWANKLNLVIPNAHLRPKGNYDLIHCAHCLSKNKDKPWVADIESVWSMWLSGMNTKKGEEKVRKILISKNCKKIMPWTEHTKKQILKKFPEIKDKIEVLSPAVPTQKLKRKRNRSITILYVSRYFWVKGGLIALKVLSKIKKKYRNLVEIKFISDVPDEIKKEFSDININNLISQENLFKIYQETDILFYPGIADTFGFALLEAMSFGIPIISINTNDTPSRKEIVKNGKNGLIFDVDRKITRFREKDYVEMNLKIGKKVEERLFQNLSKLIENKSLREKMLKNCQKIIKDGKFSVKVRNEKLKKIYAEALK